VRPEDEQRLALLAVQAREAALSLGVALLCLGPILAIATGPLGGIGAFATGAGLLRFAGSGRSELGQR
jgi:hypothetical protein